MRSKKKSTASPKLKCRPDTEAPYTSGMWAEEMEKLHEDLGLKIPPEQLDPFTEFF